MSEAVVHSIMIEEYDDRPEASFAELQGLTVVNLYPTEDKGLDLDSISAMVEREALNTGINNYLLEDKRHTVNWGASSFGQEIVLMVAQGLSGATPAALVAYLIHKSRQAKEDMQRQEPEEENRILDLAEHVEDHNPVKSRFFCKFPQEGISA
jgi:asparagine synthetase A